MTSTPWSWHHHTVAHLLTDREAARRLATAVVRAFTEETP